MEEQRFSPDQPEEVIELFDIVKQSAADGAEVQAGESVVAGESGEEGTSPEFDGRPSAEDTEPVDPIASGAVSEETEGETEETGELSSDGAPLPEEHQESPDAASSCEGSAVPSCGQNPDLSPAMPVGESPAEVQELRERIAALEKANRELADNVESLSQQLAQVGPMVLEDASVRLGLEEMVSRMLDARIPVPAEQDESPCGSDLSARMEALERRVQDWESRSGQMAAAAAARVIREEIAAMKAEAADTSSL